MLDEIAFVATGATAAAQHRIFHTEAKQWTNSHCRQRTSTQDTESGAGCKVSMRFNLQEILGAGGSGLVIKARDKQLGAVAIKVVKPQVRSDFH